MTEDISLIDAHLDTAYYLSRYPKVRTAGLSPAEHYLRIGGFTGHDPIPQFSSAGYLRLHEDVAAARINPFLHYLRHGREEGRETISSADADGTAYATPDLLSFLHPGRSIISERIFSKLKDEIDAYRLREIQAPSETPSQSDTDVPPVKPAGVDQAFLEHVRKQIGDRTLSLDIWDTLLRRRCDPDTVKLRSARAVWLRGMRHADVLAALHPVDLFQLRRMAERFHANGLNEYRYEEVAGTWLEILGLGGTADPKDMVAFEMEVEKDAAYPDETMSALLEEHQGRSICVSDFYLSAENLSDILEHHGLTKVDQVYASCDHLKPKRTGELFDVVLETEEADPAQVFHIGDRPEADVTMPHRRGIGAELYVNLHHEQQQRKLHGTFWTLVAGDTGEHERAVLDLLGLSAPVREDEPLPVVAMAIVMVGFALKVIEDAQHHGVDAVHFCTREGVFFKRVYDLLTADDVYELRSYPESKVLHVSRRATFGPSLKSFSESELMRLWNQYSHQSLHMLAKTLNLDTDTWQGKAEEYGLPVDEVVELPWEDNRVQRLLHDLDFVNDVRQALWAQRAEICAYIEKVGLSHKGHEKTMMVDIGWRGTIQESLSSLIHGDLHGTYLGLDGFVNRQPSNTTKSAYLFDRNKADDFAVHEYSALEFLFNSPGGSVTGYSGGEPQTEVEEDEESVITGAVAGFQQEILAAVPAVARYVRMHGLVATDLKQLSRRIVSSYMNCPPKDVAAAFLSLSHNETFGTGAFDDMSDKQSRLLDAFETTGAELHHSLLRCETDIRWIQAFLQAPEIEARIDALPLRERLNLPTCVFAPAALRGKAGTQPEIVIAAPTPITGSGGHRTIYNMGRRLSELGAHVHVMSEKTGDPKAERWMHSVTENAGFTFHDHWSAAIDADVAIATIAHSTYYVRETFDQRAHTFYFVQDYEAEFNPVSDGYLRAQDTYTQTQNHLSIGNWLSHVMSVQYGRAAAAGGLGVDHEIYGPVDDTERRKQIAFLYQPEKWRRAPELCIEALRLVKQQIPDAEIVVYGSGRDVELPFAADRRGLVTDLQELNRIYNESRVGLCISGTNPSRIPFEMMAAGCVPVDLYRYNNLFDYASGTGVLAYQTPHSVAAAICALLKDEDFAQSRSEAGLHYVSPRGLDWETDVAANAVDLVLSGGSLGDLPTPLRSYHDAPVVSDRCDTAPVQSFLSWQAALADMKAGDG